MKLSEHLSPAPPGPRRRLGKAGLDLIKHFESLELAAYPDPASELGRECLCLRLALRDYAKLPKWELLPGDPWTIGYGHTGRDVKPGKTVTAWVAEQMLELDVMRFERDVDSLLRVDVTPAQFDALVSFAYNVGSDIDADTKAEGLGDSTLLRLVNERKFDLAAAEFPKWNKAGGKVLNGLTKRRGCEQALFQGREWRSAL